MKNIKLYRFRTCNERNINSLIYDQLYASTPITFNDPYDVYIGQFRQRVGQYRQVNFQRLLTVG